MYGKAYICNIFRKDSILNKSTRHTIEIEMLLTRVVNKAY